MYLPPKTGGDFAPPPEGTHIAICYRFIDLGTQETTFQGQVKHQHKVLITWELPTEMMEDGRPFSISSRYTWSTSEKAILRQHLESWRGQPFQESDFGPGGFDIRNILGKPCLLNVVHKVGNDGKTRANVKAVIKPVKGTPIPPQTNSNIFFSLERAEFQQPVFDGFPDYIKDTIKKSPEWAELTVGPVSDAPPQSNDLNDDIPF